MTELRFSEDGETMRDYFKLGFPYKWSYRPFDNIKYFFTWVKRFFQRGSRGYADKDVWGICDYLCEILPPMINKMKSRGVGYPEDLSETQWNNILTAIQDGFESGRKILEIDYTDYEKERKTFDNGMKLFTEYFLNLWD